MKASRAAWVAVFSVALWCGAGCRAADPRPDNAPAAPPKDPAASVWRVLGLNDRQIRDLKAKIGRAPEMKPGLSLDARDSKEVWTLRGNKPAELKARLEQILAEFKEDLRDAPTYIQEGIKVYEQTQDERAAEIEKALKSLPRGDAP